MLNGPNAQLLHECFVIIPTGQQESVISCEMLYSNACVSLLFSDPHPIYGGQTLEALVSLFGEFLFTLFGGLFLLIAQLVGGAITFILELVFVLMPSARRAATKTPGFKYQ